MRKYLLALSVAALMAPVAQARLVNPSTMHGAMKSPTQRCFDKAGISSFTTSRIMNTRAHKLTPKADVKIRIGAPTVVLDKKSGMLKATRTSDSELTVNLAVDYQQWFPYAVGVYAPGYEQWLGSEEEAPTSVAGEVPDGTYQIVGYFVEADDEGYEVGSALVVAADVVVNGATSVTLDPKTATNVISSKAYNKAGEQFQISQWGFVNDESGEAQDVVIREGNVGGVMTVRNAIYHKEVGELFWMQMAASGEFVNTEDYPDIADMSFEESSAMRINDLGDQFMVAVTVGAQPDGVCNYVDMYKYGTATETLTNEGVSYVESNIPVGHTEIGPTSPYPQSETPLSVNMSHFMNGKNVAGFDFSEMPIEASNIAYCNAPQNGTVASYVAAAQASLEDYISYYSCDTTYDGDWMIISTEKSFTSVVTPTILLESGEVINQTNGDMYASPDAPTTLDALVPQSMRHSISEIGYLMGGSPVYTSAVPYSLEGELVPFSPGSYGYAGEIDGVYGNEASPTIVYNGEQVDYDEEYYSDFWSGGFYGWCYDWNALNHAPGTYDFTFTSKVLIDELEGSWKAHFAFDQTKADNVPPMLQYFQICDNDNNVNYSFKDGADATLRLMTAETAWTDLGGEWFEGYSTRTEGECKPVVEYAPFGSEDWKTLDVKKAADAEGIFGDLYEVSLADVEGEATKGWFDIKVTMTDAAGNVNEQVLSPAVKLESCVGVNEMTAASSQLSYRDGIVTTAADARITVWSAAGMKVMSASGNSLSLRSLSAGVYIVKAEMPGAPAQTIKVAVK